MGNRIKEEKRIERAIRSLLKLPENRRCINCNSLGPQYVCTTFWTFVCTNCSGIHREFTHRVKSVSMAKFTAEEVIALQAGGNERARQIYFKEWDPQRNSYLDGSNLHRLRDFIKQVYVDRKYTGESGDKLTRLRLSDRGEPSERKVKAYTVGSRSPRYEDRSERSNPAGRDRRSLQYSSESCRSGVSRRSSLRFEVVDDRFRDDGTRCSRRYDGLNFSNKESKETRSSNFQKNVDTSTSPVVRPVGDILGDNAPYLQLGDVLKFNDKKDAYSSVHNQKTASSDNLQSVVGNSVEQRRVNLESLIDFSTDSESCDAKAAPKTEQSSYGGNQPSCEVSAKEKAPQASTANSLESLLFGFSTCSVGPRDNMSDVLSSDDFSLITSGGQIYAVQSSDGGPSKSAPDVGGDSIIEFPETRQLPGVQQGQPSSSPAADNNSNTQQTTASGVALDYQPWTLSTIPHAQLPSASVDQSSQDVSKPALDSIPGVGSKPQPVETKSYERKELPVDLFAASYSGATTQVSGWQSAPPHGMGFDMQYYSSPMATGSFPYSSKSTNPFDLNGETNPMQASLFSSMASLHGAFPNVSAPSDSFSTSCQAAHSSGLIGPQLPSYASMVDPRSPSFASALSSGAYMGQEVHSKLQGVGGFGIDRDTFGFPNTIQQPTSGYPAPTTSNSYSSRGGNPFG